MNKTLIYILAITVAITILFYAYGIFAEDSQRIANQITIKMCNEIMENIYKDIVKIKAKYEELIDFDEECLRNEETYLFYPEKLKVIRIEYRDIHRSPKDKTAFSMDFHSLHSECGLSSFAYDELEVKKVNFSLCYYIKTTNLLLKDEISKIIKRNTSSPE